MERYEEMLSVLPGRYARLVAAAPDLLWFCQQVLNGLDTNMIRVDTPADETLANVLARGRVALKKATGDE